MKSKGDERRHFTLEQWTDFARKAGPKSQVAAMGRHLEDCRKCREMANLWTKTSEVARRQQPVEPPDAAVRTVKGMFAIYGPKRVTPGRSRVAELLFDSLLSPLQAGVRSSAEDSRQLLFGSGDYRIDLRFKPQDDSDQVLLVGQVLNAADPAKGIESAQVMLWRRHRVYSESRTNRLGEFSFECTLEPQIQLLIALPGNKDVVIPLVHPFGSGAQPGSEVLGLSELKDGSRAKRSTRKRTQASTPDK